MHRTPTAAREDSGDHEASAVQARATRSDRPAGGKIDRPTESDRRGKRFVDKILGPRQDRRGVVPIAPKTLNRMLVAAEITILGLLAYLAGVLILRVLY